MFDDEKKLECTQSCDIINFTFCQLWTVYLKLVSCCGKWGVKEMVSDLFLIKEKVHQNQQVTTLILTSKLKDLRIANVFYFSSM